jgi:hypothetical protein
MKKKGTKARGAKRGNKAATRDLPARKASDVRGGKAAGEYGKNEQKG